jgi:hypothetical protein
MLTLEQSGSAFYCAVLLITTVALWGLFIYLDHNSWRNSDGTLSSKGKWVVCLSSLTIYTLLASALLLYFAAGIADLPF